MNRQTMPEVGMILYSRGHDKRTAQVGVVVEVLPPCLSHRGRFKVDWEWLTTSKHRWFRMYDFNAFSSFTIRGKVELDG